MIRVLLVDDSAIIRTTLRHILGKHSEIEVVGFAVNGEEAVRQNRILKPDVIIMDIYMPVLDGIEATKRIMKERPCSIIIYSSEDTARMGYTAMEAGALDMIKKPDVDSISKGFYDGFVDRIIALAPKEAVQPAPAAKVAAPEAVPVSGFFRALFIGASTGGPVAVQKVLAGLGSSFPLPVFVTQHIDKNFDGHYAEWLNDTTGMPVELAHEGTVGKPGHVYIAPAGYHMLPVSAGKEVSVHLDQGPEVHFLRPAVDPMFSSAASLKSECLAVLLTGMGRDGADGALDIHKAGGFVITESEETCVVYGMPKAADDLGASNVSLRLEKIAAYVTQMVHGSL
ncbi:MAG: chemotaxis-specific protein-glutamate methyltransferase CheB [Treponemataceae bacterium]|nr:chemotaxis-specific protein-glutamate methyltransferase CheB [Treponemataceae bacterium]